MIDLIYGAIRMIYSPYFSLIVVTHSIGSSKRREFGAQSKKCRRVRYICIHSISLVK